MKIIYATALAKSRKPSAELVMAAAVGILNSNDPNEDNKMSFSRQS